MARYAKICRLTEHAPPGQGISIRQRGACREHVLAQRDLSRQGNVCGKRVVDLTVWIWGKANAREEIVKLSHLGVAQSSGGSLQIGKRLVEGLDVRAVAAPVKWLVPDNVLQRLRHHHSFHGMVIVRRGCALAVHGSGCDSASGIA